MNAYWFMAVFVVSYWVGTIVKTLLHVRAIKKQTFMLKEMMDDIGIDPNSPLLREPAITINQFQQGEEE